MESPELEAAERRAFENQTRMQDLGVNACLTQRECTIIGTLVDDIARTFAQNLSARIVAGGRLVQDAVLFEMAVDVARGSVMAVIREKKQAQAE